MKKLCLVLISFYIVFLVSCSRKADSVLSYSNNDIYLDCIEYGCISGFPKELLILESEEQLDYIVDIYKEFSSLPEFSRIITDYPIGEYIYVIQYYETSYGSEVTCNELNINKKETTIHFEYEFKNKSSDNPTALNGYVTYAILPNEYLNGFDFSNQHGVLYLGK